MPDIGFGEIIAIIVVGLLVFGPDRLPKVAADAARTLRQVRQMAASARKDLVDAAGLETDGEMAQTVRDLKDLDPRRAMQGMLTDDPAPGGPATAERAVGEVGAGTARPAPGDPGEPLPAGSAATGQKTASGPGASSTPAPAMGAAPVAPPVVAPSPVDPDWT